LKKNKKINYRNGREGRKNRSLNSPAHYKIGGFPKKTLRVYGEVMSKSWNGVEPLQKGEEVKEDITI